MGRSWFGVRSLMRNLLWILLLASFGISAQVADFLPTQKTISKPFGLPVRIGADGSIDYLVGDRNLVFAPGVQIAYDSNFVQYSIPEVASEFSLQPPKENTGWMEFKRRRYEYGLGLIAVLQKTVRMGLAPYKGAKFAIKRLKMDKDFITSGKNSGMSRHGNPEMKALFRPTVGSRFSPVLVSVSSMRERSPWAGKTSSSFPSSA